VLEKEAHEFTEEERTGKQRSNARRKKVSNHFFHKQWQLWLNNSQLHGYIQNSYLKKKPILLLHKNFKVGANFTIFYEGEQVKLRVLAHELQRKSEGREVKQSQIPF
jgi:hypothetical protein